jgi:hypothetical protein
MNQTLQIPQTLGLRVFILFNYLHQTSLNKL